MIRFSRNSLWIVLYFFSTSNHNRYWGYKTKLELSYTSFLHQTTTVALHRLTDGILSYTSFLHQTTTCLTSSSVLTDCLILLFYIKPQPTPLSQPSRTNCLILLFYIKPQLPATFFLSLRHCLLLFYIKPQRGAINKGMKNHCLILLFYIKPQPNKHY